MKTLDELMTAAAKPRAYSYLRFSGKAQEKGDSIRRQTASAKAYAEKHGLDLDEQVVDPAVSAYRGANWEAGKLGAFLARVESGDVPKGSTLIIESVDRLTRQTVNVALPRILDLLNADIKIATTSPEQLYTKERLEKEPFLAAEILLTAIRANEESQMKSVRAGSIWAKKRANAATQPLGARLPHWLRLEKDKAAPKEDKGKIVIDSDRAEIVKSLFEQAANGVPTFRLAFNLNKQGVKPWGNARNKSGQSLWQRSYIHRILTNKAVIGIGQPCGKGRRPDGPAIPNYFPRVITDELFYLVYNAKQANAGRVGKVGGAKNLFGGGLCRCGLCGGSVIMDDRSRLTQKGKRLYQHLVCRAAKTGGDCRYISWKYADIENAFLSWIRNFDFSKTATIQQMQIKGEVAITQGQLTAAEKTKSEAIKLIGKGVDLTTLAETIKNAEADVKTFAAKVKTLNAALSRLASVTSRNADLAKALANPSDRETLKNEIRNRVKEMVLNYKGSPLKSNRHIAVKTVAGETYVIEDDKTVYIVTADGRRLESSPGTMADYMGNDEPPANAKKKKRK